MKILCVLYDDPKGGMPKSYPVANLPKLDKYPDGKSEILKKAISRAYKCNKDKIICFLCEEEKLCIKGIKEYMSNMNKEQYNPVPFYPRPHQENATNEAYNHFITNKESRGKLIFPCGAGKSLTGYWIIKELKKYQREDIMVIVGGVIPVQDYQFLFDCGAVGIYGPGTKIAQAAIDMVTILIDSIK